MTLTLPLLLKMLKVPVLERGVLTEFGVGAPPARGLRLLVPGLGPSPQKVRKVLDVGPTAVTLSERLRASVGIADGPVHSPLVPWAVTVIVVSGPIGVLRGPTVRSPGRVSTSRHGLIGM